MSKLTAMANLTEEDINRLDLSNPDKYLGLVDKRRGELLTMSINLERTIDECITDYFCEDNEAKRYKMHELILCNGKLGFKAKILTITAIIKTDPLFINLSLVIPKLQGILKERNIFAHRSIMIEQHSKWFNEGKVVFKEHYDAKEPLIYDEEKFKGIISDIRECALDFIAWHHNRHVNKDAPSPPQVYPKT